MMTKVSNERAVAAFSGLQSLRNAQSEAVAWRWRLTDSETWHTEKVDPSGRIGGAHIVVEPLYTHPAPQSEAVAWRELVQEAIDLLAERKHGNPARSPGHNARLMLQDALALTHPAPPLAVTDEMVRSGARGIWDAGEVGVPFEMAPKAVTDSLFKQSRAALTAALEAKQ